MIFTYDLTNKIIIDNGEREYDNTSTIYKLGNLFLDFINYDFSEYDIRRKKVLDFCYKYHNSVDLEAALTNSFPDIKDCLDSLCRLNHRLSTDIFYYYLLDDFSNPYLMCNYVPKGSIAHSFRDNGTLDFVDIQKRVIKSLVSCIDADRIGSDSPAQIYMQNEGLSYKMDGITFHEETIFRYKYSWKEDNKYNMEHQVNMEEFEICKNPLDRRSINYPDFMKQPKANPECLGRQIEIIHGYHFQSTEEALRCEFLKMLEANIMIRKCLNCKKYFLLNKHNGKCCDNIFQNSGLTCQQVFANKKYAQKRKEHPILKEYNKAYKRMYARQANHKISQNDFLQWLNSASEQKNHYLTLYNLSPSQALIDEYKLLLGNK